MKITTRHGDHGLTDIHGKRIRKTDILMEVLGELDTLMAQLILCSSMDETYRIDLVQITEDLTTLCSALAGYTPNVDFSVHLNWITERIAALEPKEMNFQFVYPYHHQMAAQYNLARTFARTAERKCFAYQEERGMDGYALKYMNRLSDLLFIFMIREISKEM